MKFTIDVPETEAVAFALALSDLAEDFGISRITETTYAESADEDWEDETDACIVQPGWVVELPNGLVYQVFSIDAAGRVVLDVLKELTDNVEDCFLCPPTQRAAP